MDANEQGLFAALATKLRNLQQAFAELSKQPGPIGLDGKRGETGPRGQAGEQGVAGKDGQRGAVGPRGAPGQDGRDGIDGAAGVAGDEGPIGPMPKHQWRGSELRFQQTKKKWGSWVDLRGPSGNGVRMVGVGGDFDPSALPSAEDTHTPTDIVVAMDDLFNRTAQAKSYDDRITCVLRAGYPGPFRDEGVAFATWMDGCNALAYQMLAEVQAGTRAMPATTDQALALLPEMVWPA